MAESSSVDLKKSGDVGAAVEPRVVKSHLCTYIGQGIVWSAFLWFNINNFVQFGPWMALVLFFLLTVPYIVMLVLYGGDYEDHPAPASPEPDHEDDYVIVHKDEIDMKSM